MTERNPPTDFIALFKKDMRTALADQPRLSNEDAIALLHRSADDSLSELERLEARDRLITNYLPMCLTEASGYWNRKDGKTAVEEALSEANLRLLRILQDAARLYDSNAGELFVYIQRAIRNALIVAHRRELTGNHTSTTTRETDAQGKVKRRKRWKAHAYLSDVINPDAEKDQKLTLEDTMMSPEQTPEEICAEKESRELLQAKLREHLTPLQYAIVSRKVGLVGSSLTALEIADALELSEETVTNQNTIANRKLRQVENLYEPLRQSLGKQHEWRTAPPSPPDRKWQRSRIGKQARKFTDAQVREIRQEAGNGIAKVALAQRFNVSKAAIGYIVNRKTYKDVE